MNFDEILKELGQMGRFQLITYVLICMPVLFSGAHSLWYINASAIPDYRCTVSGCESSTAVYDEDWMANAIPLDKDGKLEHYKMYMHTGEGCSATDFNSTIVTCDDFVWSKDYTIVSKFRLTGEENLYLIALTGNLHFGGVLIGSLLFGTLCDRYGRKYMFLIACSVMCIAGMGAVTTSTYFVFLIIDFIHAVGTAGVYFGFIIGVEMIGIKRRELAGVMVNIFYAIGCTIYGFIQMYTMDWELTQMLISAPLLLCVFFLCYIPESVRWLMAKNRAHEANYIINQAAQINNVVLSNEVKQYLIDEQVVKPKATKTDTRMAPIVGDILKSKTLICRYAIMYLVWISVIFSYYGLAQNSINLIKGYKSVTFIASSLIEIVSYIVSYFLMMTIGRKFTQISSLFGCAIFLVASLFVPGHLAWLIISIYTLAKMSITITFGITYVYTAEMYPTLVRSLGLASSSTIGRIGGIVAPTVIALSHYWSDIPTLAVIVLCVISGALSFKLPETLRRKMPETIEEAINIGSAPKE